MTRPAIRPARRRTLVGVNTLADLHRLDRAARSAPAPAGPAATDGLAGVYRRRDPTATPLYPLVQHHLETFLADAAAAESEGVPNWVEDDPRVSPLRHPRPRLRPRPLRRVRRRATHPVRPMPDGRTVLILSPLEFLAAMSRLIPPPRVHRHRYR